MKNTIIILHNKQWKILGLVAVITLLITAYQVASEANSLSQKITWMKDKFLELAWDPPPSGTDHYRIEILKTDLLSEPLSTSLYYGYSKTEQFKIELQEDNSYSFRVQAVSSFGALSDHSEGTSLYIYNVKETQTQMQPTSEIPSEFSLSQNYPNPFNSTTTIEYQIPHSGTDENNVLVRLDIYNMLGQRVKELVNENKPPGEYSVKWDGRNDNGATVASANYIYRLVAGNRIIPKKMIYLK